MDLEVVVTPGLGDNSYLVASGDEAAVVDPQRDVHRLLEPARRRGVRVRYVLETHVHNDYVSGGLEVHAATGAQIAGPARAAYAFPFLPLEDGAALEIGDLRLTALATPGHTPEHTSYLVREPGRDEPVAVFSGGSLIVGSAGRTDLLGMDLAEDLARFQYRSLRRLGELPDHTLLLPTHGAGSFCASGPPKEDRTSTIADERDANPALRAPDETTFLREQLGGLGAFPTYYAHMAPINRAGPAVTGDVPALVARSTDDVDVRLRAGARLIDTRDGAAFAAGHVRGSLNVPLEDSFASYVGWLVPFGTPLVLVADDPGARTEAAIQLYRIGWDEVAGHLDGGVDAWGASGRPISSYAVATLADLIEQASADPSRILDVRERTEWDAGHLDGSRHVFVGDLPARLSELGGGDPYTIACASGYRSSMAASLLHAGGLTVRLVARGGIPHALRRLH